MADLVPYPFASLVSRMFIEIERNNSIFDLPSRKIVRGFEDLDLSVDFHDQKASCPLGPAAGPQTQMAQNIVLSWLGGSRILELKTIQENDRLTIPRPCIDMRNVGYNAEWSQELLVEESLREYVKGAMLIRMLGEGGIDLAPRFDDVVYDMSVGYDLEGIRSDKVSRFVEGMLDAGAIIDELREEIPEKHTYLRDLDYTSRLSKTITLSTFHGCPPDEIERIIDYLMRRWNVDCIVKFNPMLLGREPVHALLNDVLGYTDIVVPDAAFERDTKWPQAVEIVERLTETATSLGLGFGVKFSNTLIVENRAGFLPDTEKEVYLSGAPLHVLTTNLVGRFREHFGDRIPISFSAGIDARNYAEAVALGMVPITTCSDLLRPGGYGRLSAYHGRLADMMRAAGATDIDTWTIRAFGLEYDALEAAGIDRESETFARCRAAVESRGDLRKAAGDDLFARWVSQARLFNTTRYVEDVSADARYSMERNSKLPKGIDSHLELFDCITCDKCIPVCPNDANFTFLTGEAAIPVVILKGDRTTPEFERSDPIRLEHDRQIGTFADFCNECGNCDVFCPEEGGPYQYKPLFFRTESEWVKWSDRDGFHVARTPQHDLVLGRVDGNTYRLQITGRTAKFSGDGFELTFDTADLEETIDGEWSDAVDLTWCYIMALLGRSILDDSQVNYFNAQIPIQD